MGWIVAIVAVALIFLLLPRLVITTILTGSDGFATFVVRALAFVALVGLVMAVAC